MILVLDASALIVLARVGYLDLLRQSGDEIYIPQAVYNEVAGRAPDRPGSREIAQATWLRRKKVRDREAVTRLKHRLGWGEVEAIVLAGELGETVLVLDDGTARRAAEQEGRTVVGLLGLLLSYKERGIVRVLKPLLDAMIAAGFFIDNALHRHIVRKAGEEPSP
ncbi:MAG: DUF3368 domain-containing protein [Nitrospirota bacterium]